MAKRALLGGALTFFLVFAASGTFTLRSPQLYTATSLIEFLPEETGLRGWDPEHMTSPWLSFWQPLIATECQVVTSEPVLSEALETLRPTLRNRNAGAASSRAADRFAAFEVLRSSLRVQGGSDPNQMKIRATHVDATHAATIANSVAESYCRVASTAGLIPGLRPVLIRRATTGKPPIYPEKAQRLLRGAFGAGLFAAVAVLILVWHAAGRKQTANAPYRLVFLFLLLLFLITGITALIPSANVALGIALGAWLGLVTVAVVYWKADLTKRFPAAAAAFPVVFFAGCLLSVIFSVWDRVFADQFVTRTATLKLNAHAQNNAQPDRMPSVWPLWDPDRLQTEFTIILSTEVLGRVVEQLDLTRLWTRKYRLEAPLRSREAVDLLRRRTIVQSVTGTALLRIGVTEDGPEEVALIAGAIADEYCRYRDELNDRWRSEWQTRAAFLNRSMEGFQDSSSPFLRPLFGCLLLTCVAVGGAVFAAWFASPAGRRARGRAPSILFLALLGVSFVAIRQVLAPKVYSSKAKLILLFAVDPDESTGPGYYTKPVYTGSVLHDECSLIESLLERSLQQMEPKPAGGPFLKAYPGDGGGIVNVRVEAHTEADARRIVMAVTDTYRELRENGSPECPNPHRLRAEIIEEAMPAKARDDQANPIVSSFKAIGPFAVCFLGGAAVTWIILAIRRARQADAAMPPAVAAEVQG